ncbi:MAG: transposase, partial [Anaerolineaceae bacterium]|nr:transposase [Anaerolineaceae bacterium]
VGRVYLVVHTQNLLDLLADSQDFPDSFLASPIPARRARLQGMGSNSNHDSASPLHGPATGTLGVYVGAYKSVVTRLINNLRHTPGEPIWQRNYYEHIIRNNDDLDQIRRYIQSNPLHWQTDQDDLP